MTKKEAAELLRETAQDIDFSLDYDGRDLNRWAANLRYIADFLVGKVQE